MTARLIGAIATAALAGAAVTASAQTIGTFHWQLEPYCNAVVVTITQQGPQYLLDGHDDQCGAAQRAPLTGLATANPDGTVGFGLNVVTVPGGRGVQIEARISPATFSGTWSDSAGNSGTFAFGAAPSGTPRPAPAGASIPNTFALLPDGGFLARGTFGTGTLPISGLGTRLMWHPKKAAFRAGHLTIPAWDDVNVGAYSAAFGLNTVASGDSAAAFGKEAQATGAQAVAFGDNAVASGTDAFAAGYFVTASGPFSQAFGSRTSATAFAASSFGRDTNAFGAYSAAFGTGTLASNTASHALGVNSAAAGQASLASGTGNLANGESSVALGNNVSAGANGSIVLGTNAAAQAAATGTILLADRSAGTFIGTQPNEFGVRAAGGVYFYTNSALTTGAALAANGSSWAALSDVNAKENFREVDGEDLLAKLARIPIREWNYKAQDTATRHMGPTAQDFRAAFGLGDFPLRINTIDADGVALAGVQALEARTRALQAENEALRRDLLELRARLDAATKQ